MTANRIGIDFSQDYFDLLIADSNGQPITSVQRFSHDLPGSQKARDFILHTCQAHPAEKVWIGGEATGLLWWHPFQQWGFDTQLAALHPLFFLLNPAPVKAFRKTVPPRDKTDPTDARLITRYLGVPDQDLQAWFPDLPDWPLRFATRYRCRTAHLLGRLKLQALNLLYLKASSYQQLHPFSDTFGKTSQVLLQRFATLEELLAIPLEDLASLLQDLGKGRFSNPLENATCLHQIASSSYPLVPAMQPVVHFLLQRALDLVNSTQKQLDAIDLFIEHLVQEDTEIANLRSIGGIGPVFAAGLAAELRPVQRFLQGSYFNPHTGAFLPRSFAQAQAAVGKLAGLWWPRSDSGQFQSQERHMPQACNPYLRYYLVEAADHVRGQVVEFQSFYNRKYAEASKHPHRRALVLTARKLARLVFALLYKHQTYQPRR